MRREKEPGRKVELRSNDRGETNGFMSLAEIESLFERSDWGGVLDEEELLEHLDQLIEGLKENDPGESEWFELTAEGIAYSSEVVEILMAELKETAQLEAEGEFDLDRYFGLESDDIVGIYLQDIRVTPLLNRDEEQILGKRIQAGLQLLEQLLSGNNHQAESLANLGSRMEKRTIEWWNKLKDHRDEWGNELTEEQKEQYEILSKMDEARGKMAVANQRLVVSIAKKYQWQGLSLSDLIQEGNLGLMRAVDKFDPHRGFKFSTYATWWIRQTISRSLYDKGKTIRVPVHKAEQVNRLRKVSGILEQKFGRKPSIEEIAAEMGIKPERVEALLVISESQEIDSLERTIGEEGTELEEFIEDTNSPSPSVLADKELLREQLEVILDKVLTPREAQILRLRMGMRGEEAHTLQEVAGKFGRTRERIRQIEGKALRKLRNSKYSEILKDYLIDDSRN